MATIAMAALAGIVALAYFVIAIVIAPRIKMPSASPRLVLTIRGAAIAFFVGCGATHIHILLHTVGVGARQPVDAHEVVFHVMQAVGAWLFIVGAIMRLELHVVPSRQRLELHAAVEQQRKVADHATRLASQDELTGLARRWRFDEELDRQVAHAQRYERAAALLLIDIDALKAVNDTYGHPAGDQVLQHVAKAMRQQLRATDTAARIGGDEFAVILHEATLPEAEAAAARIIAAAAAPDPNGVPRTSVSVGVAAITGSLSASGLINDTDVALYDAKDGGGNRYATSIPTQPAS
jgi:diguanylate cyclase (GGDEF)-like protein